MPNTMQLADVETMMAELMTVINAASQRKVTGKCALVACLSLAAIIATKLGVTQELCGEIMRAMSEDQVITERDIVLEGMN